MPAIVYYECPDGRQPFADWLNDVDSVAAARIAVAIERLGEGNAGDVKPVGEGVSERRIHFGQGFRIYFGRDGRELILLLMGGTKNRQQADIQEAKRLWAEYKRRKKDG